MSDEDTIIPYEQIEQTIYLIRGQKVMLDQDLAALYGVQTGALIRAAKRNTERFPEDFMFALSPEEAKSLICQFGISNNAPRKPSGRGGRRFLLYAFTEQGVAMLSSVLRSPRAVQVNVAIMRTFVKLRQLLLSHKDLARKLNELERKYDKQFHIVFEALRDLTTPPPDEPKRQIGFSP